MRSYEIRLFDDIGGQLLVYRTRGADDGWAMRKVLEIQFFPHWRFEMWRDSQKIVEGTRSSTLH